MNWSGGGTGSNPVWALEGRVVERIWLNHASQVCRGCRESALGRYTGGYTEISPNMATADGPPGLVDRDLDRTTGNSSSATHSAAAAALTTPSYSAWPTCLPSSRRQWRTTNSQHCGASLSVASGRRVSGGRRSADSSRPGTASRRSLPRPVFVTTSSSRWCAPARSHCAQKAVRPPALPRP
jgi:hypothetical protein